jgi:protein-tyrosine-phosphatase
MKILFFCTANSWRSIFCEAVKRRWFDEFKSAIAQDKDYV